MEREETKKSEVVDMEENKMAGIDKKTPIYKFIGYEDPKLFMIRLNKYKNKNK